VADPDGARAAAADAPEPTPGQGAVVLVLAGTIERDTIPALVAGVCRMIDLAGGDRVICDLSAVSAPDAVAVEALARLQLAARRLGSQVWIRDADGRVVDLLVLAGLHEIVRVWRDVSASGRL
jgi:anti-anti-sigma regulatory factor